jgi:hypothetical protein
MRFGELRTLITGETIISLKNEAGNSLGFRIQEGFPPRYDRCIVKSVSVQFYPGCGNRPVLTIIV